MSESTAQEQPAQHSYVCPKCRNDVQLEADSYRCTLCRLSYPVLFGIPDFRLRSDRYLTLEEERDKARRLYEFGRSATFDDMLAFYYEITDDVPAELAVRYQAYIHNAPVQASVTLDGLEPDAARDRLLDLGCGAGGLLIAADGRYQAVTGVDIALRWLVICSKRLRESGSTATLVCADAEALPFPAGRFTQIVAGDLVEHVYDPGNTVRETWRVLEPGGRLWLSASNRYCMGPHPTTRIWAIGYLPSGLRRAVLMKLRGVDSLRFINLVSPRGVLRLCRAARYRLLKAGPRQVVISKETDYPLQDRILIAVYRALLRIGPLRALLLSIGPAFEMTFQKNKIPG